MIIMGICLNMIVRNESKTLPRLFSTLKGIVDYYVISDTGSTDNTIDIIKALGEQYGIMGTVSSHPWVDFAFNRNIVLAEAIQAKNDSLHDCNWLMFIDADEELVISDKQWKDQLEAGKSYYVYKKINGLAFKHLFLAWINDQQWLWKGEIHNYLINKTKNHTKVFTRMFYIIYHEFEGAKSHAFRDSKEKNLEDIKMLEIELDGTMVNADNLHRFFQLGYLYKNIEDIPSAIQKMEQVAYFKHTPDSTKYSALVLIIKFLIKGKAPTQRVLPYLEDAIRIDGLRKEAYYYRAILYRKEGALEEALTMLEKALSIDFVDLGYVFFEEDIYIWKIKYELVFVYYQTNQASKSLAVLNELLEGDKIPEIERQFLISLMSRITPIVD